MHNLPNNVLADNTCYLYQNYGDLNKSDLEQVEKSLNTPFDPIEPFSTFIKRVEDIMDLAEAVGVLYTTNQIVNEAFNLITKA